MKRLQEKELGFRGEITAFMALIFILMLSLIAALIESASIQTNRSRKRADTILALESVFAEYHKPLLSEYDLFAHLGKESTEIAKRMTYYGADNMTHTLEKMELLTDEGGQPFFRQAVRYMKNWLGMEEWTGIGELDLKESDVVETEEEQARGELESLLQQEEAELPQENNPLSDVQRLKDTNLVSLVATEPLSEKSITIEKLPSHRELQVGNYQTEEEIVISDKAFFVGYIEEHFSAMTDQEEGKTLSYEQEYLLEGYGSDRENLEGVCEKILGVRTAANYGYLLTDSAKQAEAEILATALCSLLTVPEIAIIVKQLILFGWAYGEGIVDVRALLKGNRVPLVKTADTWQLQLENLAKLGTSEEVSGEKALTKGLSYKDYLKALLLLEGEETLSMRCLDLIECNLEVQMDECMTKAKVKTELRLRRGVQDSFTTTFGYQ